MKKTAIPALLLLALVSAACETKITLEPAPITPTEAPDPVEACGDNVCDPSIKENFLTCPKDCEEPPPEAELIQIPFSAIYDGDLGVNLQINNNLPNILRVNWEFYDVFGLRRDETTELEGRFSLAIYPFDEICNVWFVDLEIIELKQGFELLQEPSRQEVNVGELEEECQIPAPRSSFESFGDAVEDCLFRFRDRSIGQIVEWDWSFGDGFNSTAQHPTHTYGGSGAFKVRLEVCDKLARCNEVTNEVTVASCP